MASLGRAHMTSLPARIFGAMAFLASAAAAAQGFASQEDRFNAVYAMTQETFGQPERVRIVRIEGQYREEFGEGISSLDPTRLTDSDLTFLFRAAELVEFYSRDPAYLDDLRSALLELERRKIATDVQRTSFFRALIGLRQFDAARDYLTSNPGLQVEAVPDIQSPGEDSGSPVVYVVGKAGRSLQTRYVDIDKGTRLVVVAHPSCAFSRRAMEDLEGDKELRPVLRHVLWLAPVDQHLHLDEVSDWNLNHPLTPVVIARRLSDWPVFNDWATPHFYLLRNGKLVGEFAGWPKKGNREKLVQMLVEGQLLKPQSR